MLSFDRSRRRFGLRAPIAAWIGLLTFSCQLAPGEGAGAGSPERVSIGSIRWYVDYDAAVEVAREQDKALWVHFGENPG